MNQEQKEEIEHIILKIKDTGYLNKKIISINNQLEDINVQLQGVHSCQIKNYYIENKKPYSHSNKLYLMMKEEELINLREKISSEIIEYENIVEALDPDTKEIVIDLYILKKRHSDVAKKYHYTRQTIYEKINRNFLKVLTL